MVEQLPHCDLLRLILLTERFVLSARQVFPYSQKDVFAFMHYGCHCSVSALPWHAHRKVSEKLPQVPPPQVLNGVLDRDRGFFPLWCLVALLIFEIVDDKSKSLRHCVFPGGHPSKY